MVEFSSVKLLFFVLCLFQFSSSHEVKVSKCLKTPDTRKKVDNVIKECQEDVKLKIIKDTFYSNDWDDSIFDHVEDHSSWELAGHHPDIHDHHPTDHDHHPSSIDHSSIHDHHATIHGHHSTKNEHLPSIHYESPVHHHVPSLQNHHSVDFSHNHPHEEPHLKSVPSFVHSTHSSNTPNNVRMPMEHVVGPSNSFSDQPVEQDHYIDFNAFRKKRHAHDHEWVHPSTVSYHDKRIGGCIMQCIYEKNHAVDHFGWPTLDGLVNFYSEGVDEHGYFMATLRAVDHCLKSSSAKYHVNRRSTPEKGQTCDVAFDVFDCISDQITDYCNHDDHHSH